MKKVLVIEDTDEMRELIVDALTSKGFQIYPAKNGRIGLDLARQHLPDLILCDINMPVMDGYATLSRLKQDNATAVIPFIFLTGVSDRVNMRRGMELGANDYLTKPFTLSELLAAVNAQLRKQEVVQRFSEQRLEELRCNIILALPHELRTPLNAIIGLSGLLLEDTGTMDPNEIRESLRDIHRAAQHLHRLAENFLVYSQIELMATEPEKVAALRNVEFIPAGKIITDHAMQKALKARRTPDLTLEVLPSNLAIPSDHLKRIVEELVDNAFKFSEAGSPVRVTGELAPHGYSLTITDHGRGMSPDEIAAIGAHMQFQRKFYEQQGCGLGLIIAKRLTELQGGEFAIDSAVGQYTTIRILFPLSVQG